MKLVILDGATFAADHDISLNPLYDLAEVDYYDRTAEEEVEERIKDADMVLLNKTTIDRKMVRKAPNLKYIGVMATGVNVIRDLEEIKKMGIVVTNVPNYSTYAVAQLTFAHILSFYSQVDIHHQMVRDGEWSRCKNFTFYMPGLRELYNKKLGLVGYGNIGRRVAEIGKAFGMDLLVFRHSAKEEKESERLSFVNFEYMLKNSDIISIHCPLTEQTRNLFNADTIQKIKKGALLINTARGPIVEEQAVADALQSGRLGGYGADVAVKEPIAKDSPLLKAPNCHITPHMAWAAKEARQRMFDILVDNLKAYLSGKPMHQV